MLDTNPSAALGIVAAVATVLAWALAERRPGHRPIAWLLSVGLGRDVGLRVLGVVRADHPARVLALLADAIYLAWPAWIAGTALVVFLSRRFWPVVVGWAGVLLAIAVAEPRASTGRLGQVLVGSAMGAMAAAIVALAQAARRREVGGATPAEVALAIVIAAEVVSLGAAWRMGLFDEWRVSAAAHLVSCTALVVLQGAALRRTRSQRAGRD